MKKNLVIVSLICVLPLFSIGQTDIEFDSQKILKKGIELHDEKKYDEAILEFKKVNKNDTNFVLACLELANTYLVTEKDSLALVICNSLLNQPSEYQSNIFLVKGNALDNLKRSDEAIKVYEEGIKKYPLTNTFYHELGVLKFRQNKYKEAHDYFIKSIECNPYYKPSHDKMANLALMQGKIVPAILAWQFYLLLDNSSAKALNIISQIETIARNEYDYSESIKVDELSEQDDFSEIEALIKSKAALSNQYKPRIKLNYNITKIFQLMFEKVVHEKSDKGFYMTFYAPFFEAMSKKDYYDVFTYNVLTAANNKEVDSWLEKHKSDTKEFYDWAGSYVADHFLTYETNINGKNVMARRWFQNSKINSVGNDNAQGNNIGYWYYYHTNGEIRAEGEYIENKREGEWKYYDKTGKLSDSEIYKNGVLDGASIEYFSNGNKKTHKTFVNGELDGLQTVFFPTGGISFTYEFKGGKQNGKEIHYFQNDKLMYELNMIDGKVNGPLTIYFKDGSIKEKCTFVNGDREGKSEEFYNHPPNTLQTLANYKKGELIGELTNYFRNGKVEEKGSFNEDGLKHGMWITNYEDGLLAGEENFVQGMFDGITKYFDPSGKVIEEFIYKKDILQEYKAYSLDGKIVYQNKKDGKNNYDASLYYPNGNKKREGRVQAGQLSDIWLEYNMNGYLTSKKSYSEGLRQGKSFTYHYNGQVDIETDYEKGETNGYYRQYFENGKLKLEGAYIKDKQIGEWRTNYCNGNLHFRNFYLDGIQEGWQEYYTNHGKKSNEEFYELGYLKKEVFYDTLGNVSQEVVLKNGSGDLVKKYKNGKVEMKATYKNGMLQGPKFFYYPNGTIQISKIFESDELTAESKYYYPSGKLRLVQPFVAGNLHGKQMEYLEDGTLLSEVNFSYGQRKGPAIYYYPNKQLERDYTNKNGEAHGKARMYDETGELIIDRDYVDGILVSYSYFDKNGVLVAPITLKNETGEVKAFYKSGLLSINYTLKNGYLEGKRMTYHSNGKVYEDENYINGEKNGSNKKYYFSGKLKRDENYFADILDGKKTTYYENGKVKSEENYVMGDLHGISTYYDQAGVKTQTFIYFNNSIIDEK